MSAPIYKVRDGVIPAIVPSVPITEAHRKLACDVLMEHSVSGAATKEGVIAAAQLIADSEARASERLRREIDWLQLNNDMLTDNPVGHARAIAERQAIIDERDELRAQRDWLKTWQDQAETNYVIGEPLAKKLRDTEAERDELRAEVERLKADGAASAFISMSCRASRAETDRNNLRADLDAIKAILIEEKARAERADAGLATERADKNLWKAKCHELIAPHYILDPCLRAQKFRDALAYHPVLP
jgi:hypothetical protein